jgi:phosphoglycolate phosphatase-like HAD superfamily hydrolase
VRPTVLLFDVDGTLVTTVGVGRRALERTFRARFGSSAALDTIDFHGRTDRAIVRAALAALGEPAEGHDAAIDAILAAYLAHLEDEVARADGLRAHPGVAALLDAVARWPAAAVGLGTGNIRAGARLKLAPLRLFDRFAFGGFGCDHEHRPALLHIGATRGAARLHAPVDTCRVVVIGDTPLDVEAAAAIHADSIAVATSRYDEETLRAAGATHVFPDLAHAEVLDALRGDDVTPTT